jgi:gamma-glutamyltranspeptidase
MKIALLRTRIAFVFVLALFAPLLATADAPSKPQKAAIASQHELATQAGMEILR